MLIPCENTTHIKITTIINKHRHPHSVMHDYVTLRGDGNYLFSIMNLSILK